MDISTTKKLDDETLDKLIKYIRDDRILIRPEPKKKAIVEGLVLPDSVKEDQFEVSPFLVSRVVKCGPGMGVQGDPDKRYEMEVKPGDRIVHHKAAQDRLFLNGESFVVIGNRDVLMVIDDEAEVVSVVGKLKTQLIT